MSKNCRVGARRLWLSSFWLAAPFLAGSLLTGCASHRPRPALAPPSAPVAPASGLLAEGVYRIDSAQSEIRLLVYRAGPLAQLGHNHVISNREIEGTARIAPSSASGELGAMSFELTIAVAGFTVDEAQARSEEGADFAAEVSEDARSGTLHNLLSAEVLDAAHFANITVQSITASADRDALTSTVSATVAGHRSVFAVPFTVSSSGSGLNATGSVTLRQSAIGLTPFRALLGALAVQDEFIVKFKLVAAASPAARADERHSSSVGRKQQYGSTFRRNQCGGG